MSSARACEGDDEGGGSEDPGDEDEGFPAPLFVDGIADGVSYHRIRDLFYLFGKLRNVFMQRDKKMGRIFRFGFVRFLSRNSAVSALWALNGLKVGGSVLRVAWAKPPSPFKVVEANTDRGKGGKPGVASWRDIVLSRPPVQGVPNADRVKGGKPGAASWRDIVLSRPPVQGVPRPPADQDLRSEGGCRAEDGASTERLCRCGDGSGTRCAGEVDDSVKILSDLREVASEVFLSITAVKKEVHKVS